MYRLGFIGGGRITRIILKGLLNRGVTPKGVTVSDVDNKKLLALKEEIPFVEVVDSNEIVAKSSDVVFIAVPYSQVEKVLGEIKETLTDNIVISLAPYYRINDISRLLDGYKRIVRMNPNAPSIIGRGYIPVSFSDALTREEKDSLISYFSVLGEVFEVKDELIETYTVITGMGPTYFWFQFKTLIDVACKLGLDEERAREAVHGMLKGAISLMFESSLSVENVMDLIPSKPLSEYESNIREILVSSIMATYRRISPPHVFSGSIEVLRSERRRKILPVEKFEEEVLKKLEERRIAIDYGAGIGYFTIPMAGYFEKVYAVEANREIAEKLNAELASKGITNVEIVVADKPIDLDEGVDFILFANILHEVNEYESYLEWASRIAKVVCVIDWKRVETEFGPPLAHRIDVGEMRKSLQKYFDSLVELDIYPYHYTFLAFKNF